MAFIQCEFFSETLAQVCSLHAILPQANRTSCKDFEAKAEAGFPVLYLFHGLHDNQSAWTSKSSIERYATNRGLAVVMPAVHRSFYSNMKHGYNYWTFVSEEVPTIAKSILPLSNERANTFVAGLSMGGYGAFKMALKKPEDFAAAASLSGALDLQEAEQLKEEYLPEWHDIFGSPEEFEGSENDLMSALDSFAKIEAEKPKLYQCCGTEDYLYQSNISFLNRARELGVEIDYEEGPGDHEWGYWDKQIQRVLDWLPLEISN